MLRKQSSLLFLSLGVLCLAGSVGATTLTSSNSLDVLGYSSGPTTSTYFGWAGTLAGGVLGEASGFSAYPSFTAGSQTFDISGYTGAVGGGYQGVTMVLSMPNLTAFTGLELDLTGNLAVTLTLSDGSTVTTGPLSFGSPNFVTFTSPIQIVSAEIDSSSGASLYDVSWGTADPSQLPAQPPQNQGGGDGGGTSDLPEVSSLWMMGGGLLGLSQLIRKRKHLLN